MSENRKKKVLFITPPYHAGVVEVAGSWVPLYFVYLAGAARKAGCDVVVYDAMTKMVGHKEIEEKIREVKPDYVATGAITCTLPDALELLSTAKKVDPSITTLFGGIHPTFMSEEVFSLSNDVDFIVRGEGEHTLTELLEAVEGDGEVSSVKGVSYKREGKVIHNEDRPLMSSEELDKLDKAWDVLEWTDYNYFILPGSRLGALDTSRGCDKECTFCSQRKFWQETWRPRKPEQLIDDILEQKKYGVDVVLLTDDYPTQDRARWEKFLDLLIEKEVNVSILMETRVEDIIRDEDILSKYRKAGVIHIYVGTEATDQETIDLMKKDIKVDDAKKALRLLDEHGIITETSMILGLPDETPEKIEKTLKLAKEFNPDFCHFLAIAPWPYADMYEDLKPYLEVTDYRRYNLIDPIIAPKEMTLEEIDTAIVDCYRSFYMDKFKEVMAITNDFKREYILEAMKRIMQNSFLIKKLGDLGSMPEDLEGHMKAMKGHAHGHGHGHMEKDKKKALG
ncbi:MAG: cobalamin-dependent protein [Deltaproteobacteria bacterium]|nr:cobalamin-dependent protein [Deltaproteobacteria bacterium]